jgi:hypothetical protein
VTVQLPAEVTPGRWRHILGPRDGETPEVTDGRLSTELPAYGYHWFGRREGV